MSAAGIVAALRGLPRVAVAIGRWHPVADVLGLVPLEVDLDARRRPWRVRPPAIG